jgi:uncharacterized membrane protein
MGLAMRRQGEGAADVGPARRRLLWIGVLFGIGIAGTLDEVILHQLLQWHNFYVHTTQYWRIVSDGIFHFVSSLLMSSTALLIWSNRRLLGSLPNGQALLAGALCGAGGFNLYDGTLQHKVFQFHPVREGVADQLPYDLVFNGIAAVVLVAGLLLWRRSGAAARL